MMVPDSFTIGFVSALATVNILEAIIYAMNMGYVISPTDVAIEGTLGLMFLGYAIKIYKDGDYS